ncbi:MAG: helix-turn-helix domain-containing protein [Pseudomonadota bacterium]
MPMGKPEKPFTDICPLGRAAAIFGDSCTLMILRDLFQEGPRRFQDFEARAQGFSLNTLSGRLQALLQAGFVEQQQYQPHPPRFRYHLTERGRSLGPVMQALYTWGKAEIERSK